MIGGGQAGLAAGYFLRRAGLDFVILDAVERPGGSWPEYWDSLRLFSPAGHSMLPGWWMPEEKGHEYPSAAHVAWYLTEYERRYALPVWRPVRVNAVEHIDGGLRVRSDQGTLAARHVISATGDWSAPYTPNIPGREVFQGEQRHTVDYRRPETFAGRRVAVVGGGNSAAQILAELSLVADTTWLTARPPRFMPDDVDARALFTRATGYVRGGSVDASLGDIVMVPSVRRARDRGALKAEPMFERLTPTGAVWVDGGEADFDAILWCTGFRPVLDHLAPLGVFDARGRIAVEGTRSRVEPRLHLLGYGDWTGPASATIIGAGRTAKTAVAEIVRSLEQGE